MSKIIARRKVLLCLPALTVPFGLARSAFAQSPDESALAINAADSLYHYRALLEQVKSDSYYWAAQGAVGALGSCQAKLGELSDAVTKLRTQLQQGTQWPALKERFATLQHSLDLVEDKRTGQLNQQALHSLPATLDALQALMKDVSSTCNVDPDGQLAVLVDGLYSKIKEQNNALDQVNDQSGGWAAKLAQLGTLNQSCGDNMDAAAQAVSDGAKGAAGWQPRATSALTASITALDGISDITKEAASRANSTGRSLSTSADSGGWTALDSLKNLLTNTRASLTPSGASVVHASFQSGGTPAQSTVPSIPVAGNNGGLMSRIQALVQQPQFFKPGSTTQAFNCMAVCYPVWTVYPTANDSDVQNRTSLIRSALFFGIIFGTVRENNATLTSALQGLYLQTMGTSKA